MNRINPNKTRITIGSWLFSFANKSDLGRVFFKVYVASDKTVSVQPYQSSRTDLTEFFNHCRCQRQYSSIRLFGQVGNFSRVSFNHSSGFKPFTRCPAGLDSGRSALRAQSLQTASSFCPGQSAGSVFPTLLSIRQMSGFSITNETAQRLKV